MPRSRPATPRGFDPSRAAERAADPTGWRLDDDVRAGLASVIAGRRDIRRFRPDPVPDEVLERVLAAAHLAPSVGYMQPWRFVVVRSEATRVAVRELAERERIRQGERIGRASHFLEQKVEGIREAPLGIAVLCDHGDPDAEILGRGTIPETDLYSAACAIQNLWLTARAEGLGVGWVSFYRPEDLRRVLGVPERVEPMAWLCVGWPDERPVRPGLESAGWASRAPLSAVVMHERWREDDAAGAGAGAGAAGAGSQAAGAPVYGRRVPVPPASLAVARPSNDPAPLPPPLAALVDLVPATDTAAAIATRDRADRLVRPVGSLGPLETLVERWAAVTGAPPPVPLRAAALILCGDHGVTGAGVSLYDAPVSTQVAEAAARGETAIGVLTASRGDRLLIADLGLSGRAPVGVLARRVADGTADLTCGAAMTAEQTERAILTGSELAEEALQDSDVLVPGEIGMGNTTAAAALLAGLLGMDADAVVGRGTGLDAAGIERKRAAIERALALHRAGAAPTSLGWLQRLGGLELAGLVGAVLRAAALRRPVLLDGMATSVAALVAVRLAPAAREVLFAGHRSAEPAHRLVLAELGLEPLLDLRMRLGEGSGAALALPLVASAGRLHREMGTFAESRVDGPRV